LIRQPCDAACTDEHRRCSFQERSCSALRVERALEVTKKYGTRFKPPKTKRGLRTIALDDGTHALLLKEKGRHLRICAGIPDGVDVDLSLIRLPADALIFPATPAPGQDFFVHLAPQPPEL
jgi:hypothetical protein